LWGACKYELHSLQFDIPHWPWHSLTADAGLQDFCFISLY
jgi:hypothetical protein